MCVIISTTNKETHKTKEDKTMKKLTANQIEKLEAMGFKRWTKGNHDRLYINNGLYKIMDIEVDRYKTGNIATAKLNGEETSNSFMNKLISAGTKSYIDLNSDEIISYANDSYIKSLIEEAIEKAVEETEEKEEPTIFEIVGIEEPETDDDQEEPANNNRIREIAHEILNTDGEPAMRTYLDILKRDGNFTEAEIGQIIEETEDIDRLAEEIRNADIWNEDDCKKLCEYAGLEEEWDKADGDTFESILYEAAEILGVEII